MRGLVLFPVAILSLLITGCVEPQERVNENQAKELQIKKYRFEMAMLRFAEEASNKQNLGDVVSMLETEFSADKAKDTQVRLHDVESLNDSSKSKNMSAAASMNTQTPKEFLDHQIQPRLNLDLVREKTTDLSQDTSALFCAIELSIFFVTDEQNKCSIFPSKISTSLSEHLQLISDKFSPQIKVYHQDNETKLLAFQLASNESRVYVIINFSYDMHDVPFPFGFMNSTKVHLWRSDSLKTDSFVTKGTLSIAGRVAMVVIV